MNNNIKNMVDLFQDRSQTMQSEYLYHFSLTGLASDNVGVTYSALEKKIKSTAALIQQYTSPGDRALMIFQPGLDYIVTFWACLYAGVIAVPAYPPFDKGTVEKLQAILENSTPKIIISNTQIINTIRKMGALKIFTNNAFVKKMVTKFSQKAVDMLDWDFHKFHWLDITLCSDHESDNWKPLSVNEHDIAYLQYTSGSTGMPKGVMVTHASVLDNLKLVWNLSGGLEYERMVSWLPPYHDMGLIGSIVFPVYAKNTIMMMSPVTFLRHPGLWLKAVSEFRATISGGPNFAYELCEKRMDLSQLGQDFSLDLWRLAYNGAENIHYNTLQKFDEKFSQFGFKRSAFYPLYGLAESTVFVSGCIGIDYIVVDKFELNENKVVLTEPDNQNSKILVSAGKPKVSLIIVSEYPHKKCDDGQIGEIWLSGDSVAEGYWNNQEASKVFNAVLDDSDKKTYLQTGDLGFIYNENLYITGRIKDLIIINGKNHYPNDVELTVELSDSSIRRGCSVAFSVNHEDKERLVVIAELKSSMDVSEYKKLVDEIRQNVSLNHNLEVYMVAFASPRSIPKTTSGKLRRRHTKKLLENNSLKLVFKWMAEGDVK